MMGLPDAFDAVISEEGAGLRIEGLGVDDLQRLLERAQAGLPLEIPASAAQLRYLSRRAAAVAAALQGIPTAPESAVTERPFARYWPPPHVAIEIGLPDDLANDPELNPRQKWLWFLLLREVAVAPRRPKVRARIGVLAQQIGSHRNTVAADLDALEQRGWLAIHRRASGQRRAPGPSAYGEMLIELHFERLPEGAAIEATATERDRSIAGAPDTEGES